MTLKSHDLAHIRSVVLAGHAGGGKTTLAEQLLFRAGAIPRLGKVDDGTAHLDYEPEEQKQHRSLSLAVGTFEHGEHEITVVDTPGYPDFVAEMVQGFHAADAALFVMDASGHVEAGLENAVKVGRSTQDRRLLRHQQVRSREREPDGAPWTRCAPRSATRWRRCTSRSAPPSRSRATSTSSTAGRTSSRAARRSRSRSRPSSPTRWRRAATSCSRRRPRPTTPCSRSTSARRRSPTRSSTRASTRASASRSWPRCSSRRRPRASASARCSTRSCGTSPRPRRRARSRRPTRRARRSRSGRPAASCSCACSRPPPTRSWAG